MCKYPAASLLPWATAAILLLLGDSQDPGEMKQVNTELSLADSDNTELSLADSDNTAISNTAAGGGAAGDVHAPAVQQTAHLHRVHPLQVGRDR